MTSLGAGMEQMRVRWALLAAVVVPFPAIRLLCVLSAMSPSRQPPTKKNKMGDRPGARSLVARLVSTEQYYWQYLAVRFLPARPWPAMGPRR